MAVGDGLVPVPFRAEFAEASSPGWDKPVPYE